MSVVDLIQLARDLKRALTGDPRNSLTIDEIDAIYAIVKPWSETKFYGGRS